MKYTFHYDKLLFFVKNIYYFLYKNIYNFIKVIFNSCFYKEIFIKNFILIKRMYLSDFLSKFFFEFEDYYFFDIIKADTFLFEHEHELLRVHTVIFYKSIITILPFEFFTVKCSFFKNSFYSFVFKKSSILLAATHSNNF